MSVCVCLSRPRGQLSEGDLSLTPSPSPSPITDRPQLVLQAPSSSPLSPDLECWIMGSLTTSVQPALPAGTITATGGGPERTIMRCQCKGFPTKSPSPSRDNRQYPRVRRAGMVPSRGGHVNVSPAFGCRSITPPTPPAEPPPPFLSHSLRSP